VTTKDLQKLITEEKESDLRRSNNSPEMERLMERVYGRPFYRWQGLPLHIQPTTRYVDKKVCCFNHAIGSPSKDGVIKPLFRYQRQIYDALMYSAAFNSPPAPGGTAHNLEEKRQRDYLKKTQQNYLHSFKIKHLWVKKSTGLGITELILRMMAWLALRNNDYRGSQMVIITGPSQDMAIKVIRA
jgi:hypothetical protein